MKCTDKKWKLKKILSCRFEGKKTKDQATNFALDELITVFLAAYPGYQRLFQRGFRFLSSLYSFFGQQRKFPPHARKTSGTQGTLLQLNVTYRTGMFQCVNWKPNISRTGHLLILVSKVMFFSLIYVKVPLFSSGFREKTNTRCAKMAANLNAVQNNGNNNSKTSLT